MGQKSPPISKLSGSAVPEKQGIPLPKDPQALARLRDQLEDYLTVLESNSESVTNWLEAQKKDILIEHRLLHRAIVDNKNETQARALLKTMGARAGFILGISDFETLAADSFGADCAFLRDAALLKRGMPGNLLRELPAVTLPDDIEEAPPEPQPPAPPEEKGLMSTLSSWFKKNNSKQEEEQRAREKENIRRQWVETRNEIIGLQSDRHYYIDGFMDWIGETLEPAPETEKPAAESLLLQYQDPAYIIRLAERDFYDALETKTEALHKEARYYCEIASLLDRQDVQAFSDTFYSPQNKKSDFLRAVLLKDFGAKSIADIALNHIVGNDKRAALFRTALMFEEQLVLTGLDTPAAIFDNLLSRTLEKDPLPPHALHMALLRLYDSPDKNTAFPDALRLGKFDSALEKIARRFYNEPEMLKSTLNAVLPQQDKDTSTTVNNYARLEDALHRHDTASLMTLFFEIGSKSGQGQKVQALWNLCRPNVSLLGKIVETSGKDKSKLAFLTDAALDAGLLKELHYTAPHSTAPFLPMAAFFRDHILDDPQSFNINTARRLLAVTFAHGSLDLLRKNLTGPKNEWLQKICESAMPEAQKLQWIAALLEPFGADVVKANILAEAAGRATDKKTQEILSSMEEAAFSSNLRLSEDRLLINPQRIANIWYNGNSGSLKYTSQDTTQSLQTEISAVMAREILTFLKRRFSFLPETDGLFRPEKIDRLETTSCGTKMYLQNRSGDIHADKTVVSAIRWRNDFVHFRNETTGDVHSVNANSVLLIQPQGNGSHLLIDKYGGAEILNGKMELTSAPSLLSLDGLWFNPANAAIVALHPEKDSVQFRVESAAFDDFLDHLGTDGFFYTLQGISAASQQKLATALQDTDGIIAPGCAYAHLSFNIKALGYLGYENSPEHGFECNRYGIAKKPGFIQVDQDLVAGITRAAEKMPGVLQAGGIIIHKDNIDNAYYNADKKILYIVSGHRQLMTSCTPNEAFHALETLSKDKDFMVSGFAHHAGKEKPADLFNVARATLLNYIPAMDRTDIIAEHERFHVNLGQAESRTLLTQLENSGLTTPADPALNWTTGLRASLAILKPLQIRMPETLPDHLDQRTLFEIVTGKKTLLTSAPQIQKDFSIATKPHAARESFSYPPGRKQELNTITDRDAEKEAAKRNKKKAPPAF